MKTRSIGRNDPCPCDSGKKFKHCCLGKDNGTASGQGAAGLSESLHTALEGQQFSSLEEAQIFLEQVTQQQNRRPVDEFHGLSPEQMHRMLNFPFASPGLVRFPEVLGDAPTAPILTLFELLTNAIGEQGLKPTAKGNLPRHFCREAAQAYWGEDAYKERTRFGNINREDDFYDLHITRLVAELAGLIRKYKGKFILSRDCRQLLAKGGSAAIYPRLFGVYVQQFNWAYRDGHVELPFIQQSFLFTLYLLARYGNTSRPHTFYEDAFLRAFPIVLDDIPSSPIFTPEEELRRCYAWRALVDFTGFLGLAEVAKVSDELLCCEYRVKSLPLLGRAVQFQLPK